MSRMIKFILEFNNHNYIKNVTKNEIDTRKYTIKDLFINTIDKKYINEFNTNIHHNYYYFIKDNKLIHPDSTILNNTILNNTILHNNIQHRNTVIHIKCYRRQYGGIGLPGGGGSISGMINSILNSIVNPILVPINAIADVFTLLYKFVIWAALFGYWCWFFAVWLFTDLLNPLNFIDDSFNTVKIIIITIFSSIFSILMAVFKLFTNTIGGWTQGFWGWDQSSLTQKDRDSNYFKKINTNKKCYLTNTNTIPFSIILGTILCPPIGVFMDLGLTGWLNIFICIILTLFFYIPGLIYALIIIYSS